MESEIKVFPPLPPHPAKKGVGIWLAFGAVAIINIAIALDAGTLTVALPTISNEIGGNSVEAFWAGTSYSLAQCALMLLWVSISQCFGRRPILLVVLLILAIGSVLGAVARRYTLLLVGRTLQGVGAGGIVGLTTVIITDLVPLRQRGQLYSIAAAIWAVGTIVGPIIGGTLANQKAWRWIFWLNLPIVGIGLLGVIVFLKLNIRRRSLKEKLCEIDYFGSFLFIASITSFLLAITWGGTQHPWDSWQTHVPLCLGLAGIISFCLWEAFTTGPTLIPFSLFRNRSTSLLYVSSMSHGLILWSLAYYIPEYFQSVKGYSPLMSGVALLPLFITLCPTVIAVGIAIGKTGKYRWAIWLSWLFILFGMVSLMQLQVDTTVPIWVFLQMIVGIGMGLSPAALTVGVQASTPPEEAVMAATLVSWLRTFGQALGVAFGATIFQNRMKYELSRMPSSAQNETYSANDIFHLIAMIRYLPPGSSEAVLLKHAFASSLRIIWATMCGVAAVQLISLLFVKEYSMDQKHVTDQGFRGKKESSRSTESNRTAC